MIFLTHLVKTDNPYQTNVQDKTVLGDTCGLFTRKLARLSKTFENVSDLSEPPPERKNENRFSKRKGKTPSMIKKLQQPIIFFMN